MSMVRLRRLQADFDKLQEYVCRHPRLQLIRAEGQPPERYQLQFQIRSLRQKEDELQYVSTHLVEIALPLSYPRLPPQCRMLTPIFHPNIAPHAICIGDHWSPGEALVSIVARIGEMIAYQSYNTKSPLNGEAARWVDENLDQLPLDAVSMMVEDAEPIPVVPAVPQAAAPAAAAQPIRAPAPPRPAQAPAPAPPPTVVPAVLPVPAAAPPAVIQSICVHCSSPVRVPRTLLGKRVRCPRCQQIFVVPAGDASP
jgi:ubiquitin-protein ligase